MTTEKKLRLWPDVRYVARQEWQKLSKNNGISCDESIRTFNRTATGTRQSWPHFSRIDCSVRCRCGNMDLPDLRRIFHFATVPNDHCRFRHRHSHNDDFRHGLRRAVTPLNWHCCRGELGCNAITATVCVRADMATHDPHGRNRTDCWAKFHKTVNRSCLA